MYGGYGGYGEGYVRFRGLDAKEGVGVGKTAGDRERGEGTGTKEKRKKRRERKKRGSKGRERKKRTSIRRSGHLGWQLGVGVEDVDEGREVAVPGGELAVRLRLGYVRVC